MNEAAAAAAATEDTVGRKRPVTSRQFRFRFDTKVRRDIARRQKRPKDMRLHRGPIIRDLKRKLSWDAKMTREAKEAYVTVAHAYLNSTFLEGSQLLNYRKHKKLTTRELEYNAAVRNGAFVAAPLSAEPPPPTIPLAQSY